MYYVDVIDVIELERTGTSSLVLRVFAVLKAGAKL